MYYNYFVDFSFLTILLSECFSLLKNDQKYLKRFLESGKKTEQTARGRFCEFLMIRNLLISSQ